MVLMKLCAVQLASLKGDLPGNLQRHLACIEQAAAWVPSWWCSPNCR
jgi:predicted amidohydrolase